MSAATMEKAKPAGSLGSFISKLQPPAPQKAAPEAKEKADDSTPSPALPVDANQSAAPVVAVPPPAAAALPHADATKAEPAKVEKAADTDQLEKRLKDAQSWGNEEHKQKLKLERETKELKERLERIERKIDGTYEEPTAPSTEQLTYDAEMRGKLRASHRAAVKKHGEEFVMQHVWTADSPYQKLQDANPLIAQRVLNSDDPVQEALDVLQEEADAKKYGRTSEEMKKKIEAELTPKITQEILAGLKTKPGPAVNTMSQSRGESERTAQQADAPTKLDFKTVFPWGASRT